MSHVSSMTLAGEPVLVDVLPRHGRDNRYAISRAFSEHFGSHAWHHFVTLTFAHPINESRAAREVHDGYRRRLEQAGKQRVDYFGAVERGAVHGRVHVHLLLSGTSALANEDLKRAWKKGLSSVDLYDPQRGASYAAKTLHRDDSHLLLSAPAKPILKIG
jgi:hypothetical protein